MKILHISTRLILGGSQENTVLSCEGQAQLGHEVHLAFGPIYGPEGSLLGRVQTFRTTNGQAIATHVVPHLVREVRPLADYRGYRELRSLIRALQPDIVHTHSSKAGVSGRAAAWAEAASRVSGARPLGIVHTIHGPPFMPVEGGLFARSRTRLNNHLYTLAERFAARRCHVIASVADAMSQQFLDRRIGTPSLYTTVRSGIQTGPFLLPSASESREAVRARLGFSPSDFVVGTVARLAQHKGHDDLLKGLSEVFKQRPALKLLWVGDGWWGPRLVSDARAMGLRVCQIGESEPHDAAAQLILTGLVPPEQIPALMRAMDVLAHPSYREGLPRTVPQALLAGVCPVAYDCDGTGEVCRDGQTGRLVRTGDVAGLRDAILWLMDHPLERRDMTSRGRAEVADQFSTERMVQDLEQVYVRALRLAASRQARGGTAQA